MASRIDKTVDLQLDFRAIITFQVHSIRLLTYIASSAKSPTFVANRAWLASSHLLHSTACEPFDTMVAASTLTCKVCLEDYNLPPSGILHALQRRICRQCIVDPIEKAIAHEISYPPWIMSSVKGIDDISSLLEPEMVEAYKRKEAEYKMPVTQRTYCSKCSEFVPSLNGTASPSCPMAMCGSCNALTCVRCKKEGESGVHSNCEQDQGHAFLGLERGAQYQICPKCGRAIERIDGCDEIDCVCGDVFCYRCGLSLDNKHDLIEKWQVQLQREAPSDVVCGQDVHRAHGQRHGHQLDTPSHVDGGVAASRA